METSAHDFASAGASAAMKDKRLSRGGLHLVKTVSRAQESARDRRRYSASIDTARVARPASPDSVVMTPEKRAYEMVNYVLRTLGNQLGAAGLVSLPSLDRALTSATAAVLFSAEASPLFESLREQAHDLVLVNSVFCAIYFVGFVAARLAATLPNYKASYTPVGTKVIHELFHAAIGEEATRNNYEANMVAYRTLAAATGLLQPTNSGPGIFPGFPVFKPSQFSPTGFLTARENKSSLEKIVQHFTKHGFPQPSLEPTTGDGKEQEPIRIKNWKFLTSDNSSRSYEVAHADKHIGENFGRVIYWLVCSAHRMTPGEGVIVYHQQHIQLVRWLGNRFGFRVLTMATDLDWTGKHFELNPKLKTLMREWLVIVPGAQAYKKSKNKSHRASRFQRAELGGRSPPVSPPLSPEESRAMEFHEVGSPIKANSKQVRRPVRHGRSVSFVDDQPPNPNAPSRSDTISASSSPSLQPLSRVPTEPLKSAMRSPSNKSSNSPPRPRRPEAEDIPDMEEVERRTGQIPDPKMEPQSEEQVAPLQKRPSLQRASSSSTDTSKRRSYTGSPKRLSPGAGLPPFITDKSNSYSSSESSASKRSSKAYSSHSADHQTREAVGAGPSTPTQIPEQAASTYVARTPEATAHTAEEAAFRTPPEVLSRTHSGRSDLRELPGAMYIIHGEQTPSVTSTKPTLPTGSPNWISPVSTPAREMPEATLHEASRQSQPRSGLAATNAGDPSELSPTSPQMGAHWTGSAGMAAYSGLSDALRHSPSNSPPVVSADAQLASGDIEYFRAAPRDIDEQGSSVASVPSTMPDTPTQGFGSPLSQVQTPTSISMDSSTLAARLRRKAPPPPVKALPAVAQFDFDAEDAEELSIRTGDRLEIIEQSRELEADGWCKARLNGNVGLVPLAYVEMVSTEQAAAPSSLGAAPSAAGDDAVSLWSGFNEVIRRSRRASSTASSAASFSMRAAFPLWTDVEPKDFDSSIDEQGEHDDQSGAADSSFQHAPNVRATRSRSNSTLRPSSEAVPLFHDPSAVVATMSGPSIDTSPLISQPRSTRGDSLSRSTFPDRPFDKNSSSSSSSSRGGDNGGSTQTRGRTTLSKSALAAVVANEPSRSDTNADPVGGLRQDYAASIRRASPGAAAVGARQPEPPWPLDASVAAAHGSPLGDDTASLQPQLTLQQQPYTRDISHQDQERSRLQLQHQEHQEQSQAMVEEVEVEVEAEVPVEGEEQFPATQPLRFWDDVSGTIHVGTYSSGRRPSTASGCRQS